MQDIQSHGWERSSSSESKLQLVLANQQQPKGWTLNCLTLPNHNVRVSSISLELSCLD
jgi:hypothetical protein